MALTSAALATQMTASLVDCTSEATAITNFSTAYQSYAASAMAGAVPITPAGLSLGSAAMAPALVGMGASGAGPVKFTAGCVAFWAAVAGGLSVSFAGAVAITPPSFAGLTALLTATFASNVAAGLPASTALSNFAQNLHSQTILGGVVTLPGPSAVPIL